jgi:glycosyltransferase involved in cell wall biosynthesis
VPPLPISIFFITKNEADRLPVALAAIRGLSDDVVVVDSGSDDATREVARAGGARVLVNAPFPGYGPQKRFAEDACTHTWLLNLDADEVVTPQLVDEIRALFASGMPAADGYEIAIVDVFPGEAQPAPLAYRLTPVRLYRRDRGRYVESTVHDRVAFDGKASIARLKGIVHHHSVRSLGEQLTKLNAYSIMQARDFVDRGRRLPRIRVFTEFPMAFFKAWFGRRLFLRGAYGFLVAMNYAMFRHMRVMRIYETERGLIKGRQPHR